MSIRIVNKSSDYEPIYCVNFKRLTPNHSMTITVIKLNREVLDRELSDEQRRSGLHLHVDLYVTRVIEYDPNSNKQRDIEDKGREAGYAYVTKRVFHFSNKILIYQVSRMSVPFMFVARIVEEVYRGAYTGSLDANTLLPEVVSIRNDHDTMPAFKSILYDSGEELLLASEIY